MESQGCCSPEGLSRGAPGASGLSSPMDSLGGRGQGSEIGSLPFGPFLGSSLISALGLCLEGIAEPVGPKHHLVLGSSCPLCCPQGSLQPGPPLGLQAGAPGLLLPLNDHSHFKGPSTPSTLLPPPVLSSSAQTHIKYLLQF